MRNQMSVKQAVWDIVLEITGGSADRTFTIQEVKDKFAKKHPERSVRSVESRIIKDCVNHDSHEHHTFDENKYTKIEHGKYRLSRSKVH